MRRLTVIIASVFIACAGFAQERGTLTGVVMDGDTDETVIGANVVLLSDKGVGASTDFDGNYSFTLPPGKHTVVCTFVSMQPDTTDVVIVAGEKTI
ncbi:MAG: carboxypeptidase-like regulatory domain-containing protein, partial [Flavobacteriales bacterium]